MQSSPHAVAAGQVSLRALQRRVLQPTDTQGLSYPAFTGVKLSASDLPSGRILWNAAKPGIF